jgi:hypothetical protein
MTENLHSKSAHACTHYAVHGLTCDEFDQLRSRAAGQCEICRTPERETSGKRLVIDHFEDYRIGLSFIRGLLCDRCNLVVMACVDGRRKWGANKMWEQSALAYEMNSWQGLSAAQRSEITQLRQGGSR